MLKKLCKQIYNRRMLVYAYAKSKNQTRASFVKKGEFTHCGEYESLFMDEDSVLFKLSNSTVRIRVLSDSIIKITMLKGMGGRDKDSPAICKKNWPKSDFEVREDGSSVYIITDKIRITLEKVKFNMIIEDSMGVINEDFRDIGMGFMGNSPYCSKHLSENEHFYGFGEKTGPMDKRGWDTINWNTDESLEHSDTTKCLYISIPFFIGLRDGRAYGIFLDSTYKTYFNMGKENTDYYYFCTEDKSMSYYFIYGPTMEDVAKKYTSITGRMKMPPLWALGFQQSRWSYYPQEKVMKIAAKFREKNIPCDAIYLDIDYMDGFRVFTIDNDRFPDFEGMIKRLHSMGFRLVTIIDPGVKIDKKYEVYKIGHKNGYFIRMPGGQEYEGRVWPMDSVFPDFSMEDARKWWGKLNGGLINRGVDGIWNDMNEPSIFNSETKTMPAGAVHRGDGGEMNHSEFHNLYGMMMDKATYEGMIEEKKNRRPFLLSRSGFAGIQRYAAVWTGDNTSLWEHLKLSISMNCNMGLSGVAFSGSDVGGFGGNCSGELLARWTELGALTPFFRNHSKIMTKKQEPWAFGDEIEGICRKYIELRYMLLPYMYNLFREASLNGTPVMRPLVYKYLNDERVYGIEDEFMVGDSLLAAPVVECGKRDRSVYLPEGTWFDFWSNRMYLGKRNINVKAPIDVMPLYVKCGSIIPMWEAGRFAGEKRDILRLNIYPGRDIKYCYYEDDGETFDYEKGEYNITEFTFTEESSAFIFKASRIYEGYDRGHREFVLNIAGIINIEGVEATGLDGSSVKAECKQHPGVFEIRVPAIKGIEINIFKTK